MSTTTTHDAALEESLRQLVRTDPEASSRIASLNDLQEQLESTCLRLGSDPTTMDVQADTVEHLIGSSNDEQAKTVLSNYHQTGIDFTSYMAKQHGLDIQWTPFGAPRHGASQAFKPADGERSDDDACSITASVEAVVGEHTPM